MHPEILHVGFIHLRSYGLMMAVAFVVGTFLALRESRRLGLDEDKVVNVILVTLVASVLGARMLYVLEHLPEFRREWTSALALWQGGLTLYGGIVAGTVVGLWMAKRQGLSPWRVADAMTPGLALGTGIGRIGCFLNGCCYGHPTRLPWGVVYPPDTFPGIEFGTAPLHPSQLYFTIAGVALFAAAWAVRKRVTAPGQLFWGFIVAYSVVRILLDFTRAYEPQSVIGHLGSLEIAESQLVSVALGMFGLLMMVRVSRRGSASKPAPVVAAPSPPAEPPVASAQP